VLLSSGSAHALVIKSGTAWPGTPDPKDPTRTIYRITVCAVEAAGVPYLSLLESALSSSWELNSNVKFEGFVACSTLTPAQQAEAVGWHYSNDGPQNSSVGYSDCKGNVTPGSFCVQSGIPPSYVPACQNPLNFRECFSQYAIHEFGHVLGFEHEQDRWDRPCGCNSGGDTSYGVPFVYYPPMGSYGTYDQTSIMAYGDACTPSNSGSVRFGSPNVSSIDIGGLQSVYGAPPPPRANNQPVSAPKAAGQTDARPRFDATKCPPADALAANEINRSECGHGKPQDKKQYCQQGVCVERSDDPHHPRFLAKYPVETVSGEKAPKPAGRSGSGAGMDEYIFNVPCTGQQVRSPNYAIPPASAIIVTLQTDGTCAIRQTWWLRDHWTVTCWVERSWTGFTRYRCQNWNTIWGDTHYAFFKGISKPSPPLTKPAAGAEELSLQVPAFCHEGSCIPASSAPEHPSNLTAYPVSRPPPSKTPAADPLSNFTGRFNDTTTTPQYTIPPSGSISISLYCPNSCVVQKTNWYRDHWTVTCWVEWATDTHTNYRCQNWNTIWGDPHPAWFDIQCEPCAPPTPAAQIKSGAGLKKPAAKPSR
jgi:hypothetical protein